MPSEAGRLRLPAQQPRRSFVTIRYSLIAPRPMRHDGRQPDQLRPITIERGYTRSAPGSVWIQAGRTTVLCTASIDDEVPSWKASRPDSGGWLTAEYSMLPGSTAPRKRRERAQLDGRTNEIQRLIGRSLRAVVDVKALGRRTVTIDCDVLEADGGTRTLSITGGYIALVDALSTIEAPDFDRARALTGSVAAVSVGIASGVPVLDLDYVEDSRADVDFNVVMTGAGRYVEVQGTAERGTFDDVQLAAMMGFAKSGVRQLLSLQRESLGDKWPLDKNKAF
jgi:ribonuclease PH